MNFESHSLKSPGGGGETPPNSIFSGINKGPDAPYSAPAAPDPAIGALKQKMEALEKNLAADLEKKVAGKLEEGLKEAQTASQGFAAAGSLVLKKLEQLEGKLRDFQEHTVTTNSRNVEEAKISARREIEDLLKAVREQQKFTEMDRQMHEQLEKSWARVEELEKKLMDLYGRSLDQGAKDRETGGDVVAQFAELRSFVDRRVGEAFDCIAKMEKAASGFAEGARENLAEVSHAARDIRAGQASMLENFDLKLKLMTERFESLSARVAEQGARLESDGRAVRDSLKSETDSARENFRLVADLIKKYAEDSAADSRSVKESLEAALDFVRADRVLVRDLEAVGQTLSRVESRLAHFTGLVDCTALGRVAGVSGEAMRNLVHDLTAAVAEIRDTRPRFESAKIRAEARVKNAGTHHGTV